MPIYGAYLYDAVYQYAIALNKTLSLKQPVSGHSVAEKMQDVQYDSKWLYRAFFVFTFFLWVKTVIDDTYVQKCTKLGARSILGNVAKCRFLKSKRRPSCF